LGGWLRRRPDILKGFTLGELMKSETSPKTGGFRAF